MFQRLPRQPKQMFFDNLSRFAGVSEHVTLEVSEASRRAAGETLSARFVRGKGLYLSRYAGVKIRRQIL
jgi:hypothetical protein